MTCSPARLAANRANALGSTGPGTPEGKEASRAAAPTHGMRAEVVAPGGESADVARRVAALEQEMGPSGELGRILVRRIAVLANRLARCERHEAAMVARRVREAGARYDDARLAEIEELGDWIAAEPATHVRRLKRTPEGIAWMIQAWLAVKSDLFHPTRDVWNHAHRHRIDNLMGRTPGQIPWSPIDPLCRAAWGDFSELTPDQGGDLPAPARKAWARDRIGERIDAEVAKLEALRVTVEANPRDRAEAAERALFDPSREAVLAREYEAEAERGLYRALQEFRQVEADAKAARAAAPTVEAAAVGDDEASGSPEGEGDEARDEAVGSFFPG